MKTILGIILFILVLFIIGAALYTIFDWFKIFYHNVLGWHKPNNNVKERFDGLSIHSKCRICGKDIMQDSQGNWF